MDGWMITGRAWYLTDISVNITVSYICSRHLTLYYECLSLWCKVTLLVAGSSLRVRVVFCGRRFHGFADFYLDLFFFSLEILLPVETFWLVFFLGLYTEVFAWRKRQNTEKLKYLELLWEDFPLRRILHGFISVRALALSIYLCDRISIDRNRISDSDNYGQRRGTPGTWSRIRRPGVIPR